MKQEEIEFLISLELSIHRALWGEVVPSLRKVMLKWQPGDEVAWVLFYYHGEITEDVEEHFSVIMTEVSADYHGLPIGVNHKIIRRDYPLSLPKEEHVIYLRREPFEDPKEN